MFHEVYYEVKMKKDFRDYSAEEKMEYLKLIEENVLSSGINVPMRFLMYRDWITRKYFVNNEGAKVESVIPRVVTAYNLVVFEEGQIEQAPFVSYGFTGGLEKIEEIKSWEKAL